MSVTTNLTKGSYTLQFAAGVKITDTTKLNKIYDEFVTGQGPFQNLSKTLNDGTGAGNADKVWGAVLAIGPASNTTFVISSGAGTNLIGGAGQAVQFTIVRRLLIFLPTPATGTFVVVGGAASHPWAPWLSDVTKTEQVRSLLFRENDIDGWAVGSGSADQLELANPGGTSINVGIALVGE